MNPPQGRETFFVSCSPGLEPFLLREVRALRLSRSEGQQGGVQFSGTLRDAIRANLWLRTASRVWLRLARFPAADADELYRGVRTVDFSRFLGPDGTFSVTARSRRCRLDHEVFVTQRVKDAVADAFREKHGRRPSVDLDDPSLHLHAHLLEDRCTLLADTSGGSLHLRGWRRFQGRAPLKETLAAACLLASGWDGRAPLIDPFCGSGTILVEAALLAGGMAPGRYRDRFGLTGWPGHDAAAFAAESAAARAAGRAPAKLVVLGRDRSAESVAGARQNVEAAGLSGVIRIEEGDATELTPRKGWNAWIVTNPPYGERLGDRRDLPALYRAFGGFLREKCAGFTAAVLGSDEGLLGELALPSAGGYDLKNGDLDCRLAIYRIPR
ncbi:MAG: THUMP domain-containing protein [Planctomycetes bacterium]|jgi:23S rRNA (guanine2445-N2)-methyltransferase / 23S rRNA (guanine2069-N7)-methyltransferase|nr:THUMP domain-containing protein [Planctomycetota bacterium]